MTPTIGLSHFADGFFGIGFMGTSKNPDSSWLFRMRLIA
jgi:hypothetical protein